MSNLTDLAFPFTESREDSDSRNFGLTKHEYAAILIAQGLISKYNLKTPEDQTTIAQLSFELSAEILKQFS